MAWIQRNLVIPAFVPVDVNGAAQTGRFVNMRDWARFTFVGINNDGTGDIEYTLREATAEAGTGAQDLAVIRNYWEMTHASSIVTDALIYAGTVQTAQATVDTTDNQPSVIVFDCMADELSPGYDYLGVNLAETMGAACICAAFYILSEPRYGKNIAVTVTS